MAALAHAGDGPPGTRARSAAGSSAGERRGTRRPSGPRDEPGSGSSGSSPAGAVSDASSSAASSFDRAADETKFGNAPIHVAVTTLFTEYAVLYGRIAGWTTINAPPTMTLDEALDIEEH